MKNIYKILLGFLLIIIVVAVSFFVIKGKSVYDSSKYHLTVSPIDKNLEIGSTIDFKLPTQFNNAYQLTDDSKKMVFAFSQETGHSVRDFLETKPKGYLEENKTLVLSDISEAPTVIQNTFIIPSLKEGHYKMLLIFNEEMAKTLKEGKDVTKPILISLDNKKVVKVEYASNSEELQKFIEQ